MVTMLHFQLRTLCCEVFGSIQVCSNLCLITLFRASCSPNSARLSLVATVCKLVPWEHMFIENDRAEKDGGLFALFRISVCQYKLNLYAKETYYAYLKVYTTANPQTCICSCKIQPLSTVKLLYTNQALCKMSI